MNGMSTTATKKRWVNFKELRSQLKFAEVLKHYGVELKVNGDQATGMCPLPTHNGEEKKPAFSANLIKGIWQCFGCGAKGNVLDFAVRMEGLSPEKPFEVRTVALKLQEKFGLENAKPPKPKLKDDMPLLNSPQPVQGSEKPVVINQPLDFELKGLEEEHPYLRGRGLLPETIKRFGLGFCNRGMLKDRIAIPIHNVQGKLLGYAGRTVDDSKHTDDKYLFPGRRERNGVVHEFRKSLVLYNANRIIEPAPNLVLVEGFVSVWWLYQHGFKDVGALMGSSCSPEQAQIVLSKVPEDGTVIVFPDGDDAGKRCAHSVFHAVAGERSVRWIRLPDGKQPTDCSGEELQRLLSNVCT
jgi:DNA primase